MIPLVNPVPTSGQVRETRRRIRHHLPAAIARTLDNRDTLAAPTDHAGDTSADAVADRSSEPAGGPVDPDSLGVLSRVVAAVSLSLDAGLDVVEQFSDEAHDTVEENLARVTRLLPTVWSEGSVPLDPTSPKPW